MKMSLFRAVLTFVLASAAALTFAAEIDPAVDYPLERGVDAGRQWKEKLGLSDDQVRSFSALEKAKAARLKPLRELLRSGMVKLQGQLAENAPQNEVEESLNQVLQTRRAISQRNEKLDERLASFLSPSQRARLFVWQSLGGLDGYAARRLETAARPDPHEEEHER